MNRDDFDRQFEGGRDPRLVRAVGYAEMLAILIFAALVLVP